MRAHLDIELEELTETMLNDSKRLILHNDDYNSFEHVISCMRLHLGASFEQGMEIALKVHNDGHAILKEGSDEELDKLYLVLNEEGLTVSIA